MKKILLICLAGIMFACSQAQPGAEVPLERSREFANALYNQQLYWQAIDEYKNILDRYTMENKIRANINYTVGNIYFEEIGDFANALSFYLKVKHLFRNTGLDDEVNKKVVACLERLGKSKAAAAYLRETTSLKEDDSPFESIAGDTLSVIGEKVITMGDFERLFNYYRNSLPPDEKAKEATLDQKVAFLRDYVKSEVLYNSARMQKLDQDKEVLEIAFLQKKQLMIQKLLETEINSKIVITDEEIKQFYDANKDKLKLTEGGRSKTMTLSEARGNISQLLFMRKAAEKQNELTDRLIEAQNAKIFVNKIK